MKARDVVPNWPRGRSTSKRLAAGSDWPWQYAHSLTNGELLHVGERIEFSEAGLRRMSVKWEGRTITLNVSDPQMRQMDAEVEQAEERRKVDMMEGWYECQRLIVSFNIRPELIKTILTTGHTGILTADTLRSYLSNLRNEVKP